ncbi:MAG: Ig-like domain repeat protein [Candidatus Altiarchaeum hamiconexum]|uniref:Ig-like domain repeat protein n=1 Tax=Candidatus Altarchaeum hamiconexum TaxID=1803513 RepID=A0A8J8CK90_9ARCH|nr:Ig-like domain repeat protein [Candidatus Altarchaeum hamiconexum]OIQ05610.1 MAG: hypothetical protein AUK59_03225 [Candidatus Altarchaeum sp. CG2_30_32_3053]PIV27447.1 MAG: hypothetical protein COS36_05695 [Candidatus Altarchaeum sp. CG03_land_8_20_14_0_80_32_618]PIX48903.1 MAG: hypothetical protein COZ53_02415 [Candidatus Altarchaeum sp. CG_4_8_14_3_um_filter_33_2054]PIZ30777.1 MAG: hypothetical protein COY41_03655 [Candidatus Altarchaeum sp. CG_4_10_14_0_8_um_filter_32_851]PJC14049.1 MAG
MRSKKFIYEINLSSGLGVLGILAVVLMLTLSGCVEQKKDVTLTMANEIRSPVNFLPVFLYAKFNESVKGSVSFYIDDKFIGDANSNGSDVFMKCYENLSAKEYKVNAIFSGNDKFNNASASTRLQIFKHNTVLDVVFEPDERIYFKDSLNVKAQLNVKGEEGECTDKEILLYADDRFFGKNLTNDECIAEFTFKNLTAGELNVRGEYKGNEIYEDASATKNIEVTSKIPLEIFADSKEAEPKDKNVTISADMKDYLGRNISDWTLKLISDGKTIANLTAGHKTLVLDISNRTLGTHHLQVVFDGTEIYESKRKDVFIQIINKYNISGVEVKAEIPLEQIVNKKISVYSDGSNVSEYCAYEFESISDQKKGYHLQIQGGKRDSIFLGKNFGIITVKQDYEMLPCHVFLCINKNINCSIPEVIEAIGKLENLSIAMDKDVSGKPLAVYDEIRGTLGYIQAYLVQNGRQIYIKPYLINGSKCEMYPTRTAYQNLTKETNDCNFSGIFIKNADERFMGVKNGKILLEGDETGLFVEETILKWLIAPEYAYNLRIKNQNKY